KSARPARRPGTAPRALELTQAAGTDDTLMALERAFRHAQVVVLSGQIGIGLRTLAAEFIAWLGRTGDGPVEPTIIDMGGGQGLAPIIATYREAHPAPGHGDDVGTVANWLAGRAGPCVLVD